MRFLRAVLFVLATLFTISLVALGGISVVKFSTEGERFAGSEWLVGLGFGAMWVALACPVLIALVAVAVGLRRRAVRTAAAAQQTRVAGAISGSRDSR
ncbi:hypothetical protein [Leucobacter sp. Psy1]|uniref:hypothetical protein n=1 Tax=Leucobacter sp. Psy1 TaxID=2875729 RepID=UPI001CD4DA25|nr:hypothetical protein [Leucobacter sp. Psy1]